MPRKSAAGKRMPLGPIMTSIEGGELTAEDREILCHPLIGGVIYFARNFTDKPQLSALSNEIKALREPQLLIAVDHEGGRVQRFREGFTSTSPSRRCLISTTANPL